MITTLPRLVRIGDLARLTGLSIPHLRRLADEGVIPTCRRGPGHHRLFPLEEATQRVREIIESFILSNLRWTHECATIDNMNDSMITTLPRLVRIGDLARLTGLSIPHLRRLADEGVIPTCRRGPGHHRLFPLEEATQRVREIINRNW